MNTTVDLTTSSPQDPDTQDQTDKAGGSALEKMKKDLNMSNIGQGNVYDDPSSELQFAVSKLESDSSPFEEVIAYLDTALKDAWVVPGSLNPPRAPGETTTAMIAYETALHSFSTMNGTVVRHNNDISTIYLSLAVSEEWLRFHEGVNRAYIMLRINSTPP